MKKCCDNCIFMNGCEILENVSGIITNEFNCYNYEVKEELIAPDEIFINLGREDKRYWLRALYQTSVKYTRADLVPKIKTRAEVEAKFKIINDGCYGMSDATLMLENVLDFIYGD